MDFGEDGIKYVWMSRFYLIEFIKRLLQIILDLRHRVQELKNGLNLNCWNSNIPPSKDPINKMINKDWNSREKPGKLLIGQLGHQGNNLLPKYNHNDIIDY